MRTFSSIMSFHCLKVGNVPERDRAEAELQTSRSSSSRVPHVALGKVYPSNQGPDLGDT